MDIKSLFAGLEPADVTRYLPRTGNVFLDVGMRIGANLLVKRMAPPIETDTPEGKQDPQAAGKMLLESMKQQPQGVYVITGPRGQGKTALALLMAQEFTRSGRDKSVFSINLPKSYDWIMDVEPDKIDRIPNGSVVILDDTGMVFNSRDYASAVAGVLHKLIILVRHKEITIIANTGVTSLIDKYLLDCDAIFFKRPSQLSIEVERPGLRRLMNLALDAYEELDETPENEKAYVWALADRFRYRGLIWNPLPNNYTQAISRNKR